MVLSPKGFPNKVEAAGASVSGKLTTRHSQREGALPEWPTTTERSMPDSAPCVCVLLILSHVFIMRPLLLQPWRAECAADAGRGHLSRSQRRRWQTEGASRATRRLADFTLRQSIVRNPPTEQLVMKIRGDGCLAGGSERANGRCVKTPCSAGRKIYLTRH